MAAEKEKIMNQSMRTITLKLAAGTRDEITAPGNFLHLVESGAAVDIELDNGMRLQDVLAGTWAEPGEFKRIAFYSDTAQTIKILVARGRAGVFRVNGEVSVISGEVTRSKAGVAFWGSGGAVGAAGQYPVVQLFNPVASTRRVIVDQLLVSLGGVAGIVHVGQYDTAVTNFTRNPRNKSIGGANSGSEIRWLSATSSIEGAGLPGSIAHAAYDVDADGVSMEMSEPMILEPGRGVIVVGGTVASTVRAVFQLWEEAV